MSARSLMLGILFLGVIGFSVLFYRGSQQIGSLQVEVQRTQRQQEVVQHEIENLQSNLDQSDNLKYLEYLIRRELGLIYPGEEKYIIIGDDE